MNRKLIKVFERYIKNTPRKGYVKSVTIKVCDIPHRIKSKIQAKDARVYITTISLKHIYDSRAAQEFDFILNNLETVITNPHRIYKNKEEKTGDVCLYVEFGRDAFFYILKNEEKGTYLISAYRLSNVKEKRKNYLEGYRLLWSWKVDLPSS